MNILTNHKIHKLMTAGYERTHGIHSSKHALCFKEIPKNTFSCLHVDVSWNLTTHIRLVRTAGDEEVMMKMKTL